MMQDNPNNEQILAVLQASVGRRWLGVVCLAGLGLIMAWVAVMRPPSGLGWQVFLIVMAAGAFWMADMMRRVTAVRLELTETGLRSSEGEVIALLDDIEHVDRGVFAFKPSNGFVIKTYKPAPARFRPGLWWRMGKRIGLGGVTPGHQAKFMAEMLVGLLAERK